MDIHTRSQDHIDTKMLALFAHQLEQFFRQLFVPGAGNGRAATYSDAIKCVYKGTYPNGSAFDSSRGFAVEKRVNEMVPGLAEAVMNLPSGTKCKVYIPWELGYGANGSRNVAPYSALVYDLEIVEVIAGK